MSGVGAGRQRPGALIQLACGLEGRALWFLKPPGWLPLWFPFRDSSSFVIGMRAGYTFPMNDISDYSFDEIIERARELAAPGDAVLLSPACSSYDMFKNYEERGTLFRQIAARTEDEE